MMQNTAKKVGRGRDEAGRASYAEIVRFVILVCAFTTLAFVLVGHDLLIVGLVAAIGALLLLLSEAWRLPHNH